MTDNSHNRAPRRAFLAAVACLSWAAAIVETPLVRAIAVDGESESTFPARPGFVVSMFQDNPTEHRYRNETTAFNAEQNDSRVGFVIVTRLRRVEPEGELVFTERLDFNLEPGESETKSITVEDLVPGQYLAETEAGGVLHEDTFVIPDQEEVEEQKPGGSLDVEETTTPTVTTTKTTTTADDTTTTKTTTTTQTGIPAGGRPIIGLAVPPETLNPLKAGPTYSFEMIDRVVGDTTSEVTTILRRLDRHELIMERTFVSDSGESEEKSVSVEDLEPGEYVTETEWNGFVYENEFEISEERNDDEDTEDG